MSVSKGRRQPDLVMGNQDGSKQDSSEGGTVQLKPDTVGEQQGDRRMQAALGQPPREQWLRCVGGKGMATLWLQSSSM